MTRTLMLTSHSGGSGRTFCNVNLAVALAEAGLRVLLVDLDPLCGSLAFWGDLPRPEQMEPIQRHGIRAGLDLVIGLEPEDLPELHEILDGQYDYWLIDTSAPLDVALQPVFGLCDDILLLIPNDPLSFRTLPRFLERLLDSKLLKPEQFRGLLLNRRERTQLMPNPAAQLEELLRHYLLPLEIPFSSLADRALLEQQSTLELEGPESEFGQAIVHLASMLGFLTKKTQV